MNRQHKPPPGYKVYATLTCDEAETLLSNLFSGKPLGHQPTGEQIKEALKKPKDTRS